MGKQRDKDDVYSAITYKIQENVKLIVEEFITDVKNTGKLTSEKYQDFQDRLAATGNSYDVEMEIKYLDENPGKKLEQSNSTKIGENVYLSEYTSQILEKLENDKNKTITLKEGDIIYVGVKNQNSTIAQTLKSSLLKFSNDGEYVVSADSTGMVSVNGTN